MLTIEQFLAGKARLDAAIVRGDARLVLLSRGRQERAFEEIPDGAPLPIERFDDFAVLDVHSGVVVELTDESIAGYGLESNRTR